MSLELPDLRGKMAIDIAPTKQAFAQVKAEARSLDGSIAKTLGPTMRLDTAPLQEGLKKAQAEAAAAGAKMRESLTVRPKFVMPSISPGSRDGAGAGVNQTIERLVGGFRLASGAGRGYGLGAAGIALGGLEIVGRRIDAAAESMQKLVVGYQQGTVSGEEMTSQLLRSIPIAGAFGDAIARVFESASGEAEYVAQIQEATRVQERHIAVIAALHRSFDDFSRDMSRDLERTQGQIERLKLSGLPLKLFDIQEGAQQKIESIGDKALHFLTSPEVQNAQKDLVDQINRVHQLESQLANTPRTIAGPSVPGAVGGGSSAPIPNPAFADAQRQASAAQAALKSAQDSLHELLQNAQGQADQLVRTTGDLADAQRFKVIGGAATNFFDEFMKGYDKAASRAIADVQRQQKSIADAMTRAKGDLAAAGGDQFDRMILSFKALKPDTAQLDQYLGVINQIRAATKAVADDDSLAKLIEHAASPMEKFQDDVAELIGALSSLKISPGQFDEGLKNARKTLDQSLPPVPKQDDKLADLLRPGSSEAARLQFNLGRDSYQQQRDQVQQQILASNKKQETLLGKLPNGITFTFMELP